jgi:hypothetical protein
MMQQLKKRKEVWHREKVEFVQDTNQENRTVFFAYDFWCSTLQSSVLHHIPYEEKLLNRYAKI